MRGRLAGLRRAADTGYSIAKADLASFDYAKAFAVALSRTWAEAKAARNAHRVNAAELSDSFEAWGGAYRQRAGLTSSSAGLRA